ncbi:GntR family transcriptional regulator [Sphingobium sp. AS12]|uniref:GntR family transcriptional regulator n=1 Tax=Sphingobium sp. AS12 TaxID=2849495 RepID=UPI001C3130BF|nr:GntR family transcriptional regulator [Sphingobium sp. AS12]MBV2149822.1 GntR family transcriptional regulator [Sphingobium sp. AS12]
MATIAKKSATLREQVVGILLDELQRGLFAPGDRLTEQVLAERLEVSRTPAREALNQLTEQGLLRSRPGGGYVVPTPTVEEVRQIIAVRMLLEPPAVRMAAAEYGPTNVDEINGGIEGEKLAASDPNPGQFARANEVFRSAVFGSISNVPLRELISQFANHLNFIRASTLKDMELRHEIVKRQIQIRDAISVSDGDLAEGLWRSYLRYTEETLVAAMMEIANDSEDCDPN